MKCHISVDKAFDSIFKQPHWAKKLIIGGVLSLLATLFVNVYALLYLPQILVNVAVAILLFSLGIVGVIIHFGLTCLLMGYNIKFVNNALNNVQEVLPCWVNFKGLFVNGVKWLGISIIYYIMVIAISVVLTAICMIPYSSSHIWSFLLLIPTAFIVVAGAVLPLIETMFARNLEISDAFNLKHAYNVITKNFGQYMILLLTTFGIYLLALIPYTLSTITIVGVILVPFLAFIVKLLVRNLFAQFYKKALEKEGI
ncbi:MAG: DUF4013 domain-containing protein [bacterium]|jgi:uncharacterized membrane protein YesL